MFFEFTLRAIASQLSVSGIVCVYIIPQNIIIVEFILNNKMWLVFMYVNMEKEKVMNLIMSSPTQGTTKEISSFVLGRYLLPIMNNSTISPFIVQ